jgi:delta24-sterol reductase
MVETPPSLLKRSTKYTSSHKQKVEKLQRAFASKKGFLALNTTSSHNTTRSKEYKKECYALEMDSFCDLDIQNRVAIAEPRVTMDALVRATLPYGLIPKVVPEFKGITVGGAIMGAAGESTSYKYGIFNDTCKSYEMLDGGGDVLSLSPSQNDDLYYGIAGSYGSLGILTQAKVELIPCKRSIRLKPTLFRNAIECIDHLWKSNADFIDGLVFDKDHFYTIEGSFCDESAQKKESSWYFQGADQETILSTYDYLFRYDQGAFWMGAYLLKPALLKKFLLEGVFKMKRPSQNYFTTEEIKKFHQVKDPSKFSQKLFYPWLNSQSLWKIHHKARSWVNERMMVQDFCIPKQQAALFLKEAFDDPGIFPLWLCPIKGTNTSQIFSPHVGHNEFVNIGVYGVPAYSASLREITQKLERKTKEYGGRKVLYSHSYYIEE